MKRKGVANSNIQETGHGVAAKHIRRKRRWLESSIPPWHRKFGIHDLTPNAIKENDTSDYNYNRRLENHPGIIGEKAYSHHYPSDETYEGNKPTGENLLHISDKSSRYSRWTLTQRKTAASNQSHWRWRTTKSYPPEMREQKRKMLLGCTKRLIWKHV